LDNGKVADASQKVKNLSEEQKIGKLRQIRESAEEYEGFLIAEMIKSARQSAFVKTPGGDTYSEIAEKPFTAALTKAGGLGLSQTIVTQVASQEGLGDILNDHPEVMGPKWRHRLAPSQMPKPGPKLGGGQAGTKNEGTGKEPPLDEQSSQGEQSL
jgi:Rod binding domain-containing protein